MVSSRIIFNAALFRDLTVPKFVFAFTEGNKDLKDLLGGKGANLAEMTNIGLPVPPGFTITTDACRHYLRHGSTPDGPAAARVPPRPHGPVGQARPGGRPGHRQGEAGARRGPPDARAEPDARLARRPAGPGHPGPVRHAGARDREVEAETGVHLNIPIGTMIEVPRGALTEDSIAASGGSDTR
jgi:phosphoenolpyruvate synthase/pyruvate phosphate dikinase